MNSLPEVSCPFSRSLNRQWLKHSVNVVDAFIETALEKGWMDEIAN